MTDAANQQLIHQALQAERLGRFDEARDRLRQVLARQDGVATLDARLRLGKLLIHGGHSGHIEAAGVLAQARRLAEQAAAPRQAASAIHLLALLERRCGRADKAQQLLDQSPALRNADTPGPDTAQLFHYRGLLAADRNELANAERLFFRAHQLYQELHYEPGLAEICDSLANLMLRRGRCRRAVAFAHLSLGLKQKLQDRYGEALSHGTLGRAYLLLARYPEAEAAFRKDLDISTELNVPDGVGIMLNSLGETALRVGDVGRAADYYLRNLGADRGPENALHAHLGLARVHLAAGRLDDAAAEADGMAALLPTDPGIHGLRAALVGVRGAIAWRRGDSAEGERLLAQAVAALGERQHDLDTIPFLYELRDLYQRQGKTAEAVRVMARALDLLSECGAERGVDDVQEWLRRVDSPALIRLALEQHFPDYLVEGILSGSLGAKPSRKQQVVVLFSDVRDYTAMSEGLPAEEVVELLNEWFTEATRAIRRHRGVVDKFMGDAVMALFGVPEPRDEAAADAVRAALEMRDALSALNLRHRALGGKEIRIGVGVHTGEAVVGFIGSHLRQSYTAIGDVVNTASRLESATKNYPGCDILISQAVEEGQQRFGVAESAFRGYEQLPGKSQQIGVYQVLGRRSAES